MPGGFIGNACEKCLIAIDKDMDSANELHTRVPSHANDKGETNVVPHPPDTAMGGSYVNAPQDQGNIVMKPATYHDIMQDLQTIDSSIAQELHDVCLQIENMCSAIYVVPDTVPKYLSALGKLRSSLGAFQSITGESAKRSQSFVNEVTRIDTSAQF
jgi:hypothetical protein